MKKEEFECIGVDVSKNTLDVALFRGKVDWNEGHIKVENNCVGYKEMKKWLCLKGAEKRQLRVCMESTGLYTHNFRTWLEKEGITYYVVDSKLMHHFAPPQSIKGIRQTKNDKADAFRIAIYCSLFHDAMVPSKLPSAAYFKLKRLLAERRQYLKQSVLYKQQLHDISIYDTVSSRLRKEEELKNLKNHIKQTDAEILTVLETDEAIKRNYNLLISIVGVGLVVAVTTIVLTENFTTFTNPRKYASYIAIAPFPHESGTSVRGATRVSKQGFRQAKADLSISVLSAMSHDPELKEYWLRKKAEGKHAGTILNAIKFKIVLRMFAVVKRGTPYVNTKGYKRMKHGQ
jgi:transposase